jgi:aminopeptidase N
MRIAFLLISVLAFTGCAQDETKQETAEKNIPDMSDQRYAYDPHSFSRPNEVAVTHLSLSAKVDFDRRVVEGTATYDLEHNAPGDLVLDMDGLNVKRVYDGEGEALNFRTEEGNDFGDKLVVETPSTVKKVAIDYETSPQASALLWMDPAQTNDGKAPFLFTQGQAILTRSWLPIQDSPALRITYDAEVTVPEGMLAVMSAQNPKEKNDTGTYTFTMNKPIPPYLMALAVGDLAFQSLGERTGVYAEPGLVEKAAYEFADMEKMLLTAEELYGEYRWGRYDVLVLPPGFPFGGMENPMLTFATPTIIAGDRSLTSLIAHELAHSWSGNLVTNATWNDFWLNEGFTVYFEKRIMEALYGEDYAGMLNELGYQDLRHTLDDLGRASDDTKLKLHLDERNPDDGMTDVAYEKGYLFLRWLESLVGRERFDAFLKQYFEEHAFQTMTTESFLAYLRSNLLEDAGVEAELDEWIYAPGLPESHPVPDSDRFDKVDQERKEWLAGDRGARELTSDQWSTHEWLHFLRGIPEDVGTEKLAELDEVYDLTTTGNSEIAAVWYERAIENDYRKAFPELEKFLIRVGRRKFLKPLYLELAKTEEHKAWALEVYRRARPNYHAVSVNTIDEILGYTSNKEATM